MWMRALSLSRKKNGSLPFAEAIVGDNAYFKAMRVRQWASKACCSSLAATWKNGKYAKAYHHFIRQEPIVDWLKCRKTAIEQYLICFRSMGTVNNHKQLSIQSLKKVILFFVSEFSLFRWP